ncbi:penicillin acylase family protein [Colwellia sp. 1_MG-2023]|uniref:penicillin acylase family protein n=1 Tax=Colwellia sp. 1_MG-2023 TaxID=3062649 RepID=UPI0026E1308D|nr:penicillin acylase family protein [Colwellia sp. 1_MG-2023]MDO6444512.1 penicillin acylase family protein [Colwellia sp. 1_MG-2023]
MKKVKKILLSGFLVLLLILSTFATWIYSQVDSALPVLSGKTTIMGLSANAIIDRDIQGIPTIKTDSRADLAVATGFIHAQERFFQMDLLRRNAAGELASLFGAMAVNYDKSIRLHRFRDRAVTILNQLPKEQLALVNAYTIGVNEGLRALKAKPFEYLLLQQEPVAWREEDSILTILSMYLDLQYKDGARERTLGLIQANFSPAIYAFLNPKGSIWDAAIDNTQYSPAPLPKISWQTQQNTSAQHMQTNPTYVAKTDYSSEDFPGSNNWAVAGEISSTGSAIVANDMHLGIRVPNTWFRASFEYQDKNEQAIKVTGLTLPGTPLMVTGSNGNIAWGFTNSYGDWNDVIILETNDDNSQYLTPEGYKNFTYHKQMIAIKGEPSAEITIKETIWGPVIGQNEKQQLLALRWVAHDIQAVNFYAQQLEKAKNINEAFNIANQLGIPAQNMMVGDKAGDISWTIAGPIPKKSADFGEVPTSWADGKNHWQGYLPKSQYPNVKQPQQHRLWTANSRVVGGKMLAKIGNGGYALGARSQQIRDNLFAKEIFDEKALLSIALDNKAKFLERWQQFILNNVLNQQPIQQTTNEHLTHWQEIKAVLSEEDLRASTDSVAYRFVRNFRINLRDEVFEALNQQLTQLDKHYQFHTIRHQIETPLWQLIHAQPKHFLNDKHKTWSEYFNAALEKTYHDMTINQPLSAATWGQQNTTDIRHPITNGVPLLSSWLNMPATALPGDSYMPLVQGKAFGASERMVVSPGHEESGILHMPTSQAGHPLSPYYRLGHKDWEQGKPSPFLPGKTKYTLTLLSY